MNIKAVLNTLGKILQVEAGLMLLPLIVALIYREDPIPFLITIGLLIVIGTLLTAVLHKGDHLIFEREGFLIVALSWVIMSVFGALPFVISGAIPSFVDAFFETVSGFTTTGSTILTDFSVIDKSLLFWRSFTHWIGGMGVLVFIMALLPMTNSRSVHILKAETTGPTKGGKLVPKMRSTATILYIIYLALTVIEVILLLFGGMTLFEALTYSFATAGTGGYGITAAGVAGFNSPYINIVISVFMLLFGVNFNLYYLVLLGNWRSFFKNEENRWYFAIVGISTLFIAFNILNLFGNFAESLMHSFFQVASIITTTGFATADFALWPTASQFLLVLLMLIGASAGSTGGAIKVSRIIILLKSIRRSIHKMIRPNQVEVVRLNGSPLDEETVSTTHTFFSLYMLILFGSGLLVCLDGFDFTTSFTATVACLCNVGPGLGLVGPMGSFAIFSAPVKLLLSLLMLLGRLELFSIVMLFFPEAWRRR
ncbi:MAG: TrkH family potassium uptake protein [Clostridia bacterium]|nr:TrkH family potassium uptake protein [Clostridia bacterium]